MEKRDVTQNGSWTKHLVRETGRSGRVSFAGFNAALLFDEAQGTYWTQGYGQAHKVMIGAEGVLGL